MKAACIYKGYYRINQSSLISGCPMASWVRTLGSMVTTVIMVLFREAPPPRAFAPMVKPGRRHPAPTLHQAGGRKTALTVQGERLKRSRDSGEHNYTLRPSTKTTGSKERPSGCEDHICPASARCMRSLSKVRAVAMLSRLRNGAWGNTPQVELHKGQR